MQEREGARAGNPGSWDRTIVLYHVLRAVQPVLDPGILPVVPAKFKYPGFKCLDIVRKLHERGLLTVPCTVLRVPFRGSVTFSRQTKWHTPTSRNIRSCFPTESKDTPNT